MSDTQDKLENELRYILRETFLAVANEYGGDGEEDLDGAMVEISGKLTKFRESAKRETREEMKAILPKNYPKMGPEIEHHAHYYIRGYNDCLKEIKERING